MGTGTWAVRSMTDAVMTWNYDIEHADLRALYEKAKREQWNATTQLCWSQDVDPEGLILDDDINPNVALLRDSDIWRRMTPKEQQRYRYETLVWNLSQFLHIAAEPSFEQVQLVLQVGDALLVLLHPRAVLQGDVLGQQGFVALGQLVQPPGDQPDNRHCRLGSGLRFFHPFVDFVGKGRH